MPKGKITRDNPFGIDENGNSGPIEMSSADFARLLEETKNPAHRNISELTEAEREEATNRFFGIHGTPPRARTEPPEVLPPKPPQITQETHNLDTSARPIKIDDEVDNE